LRLASQRPEDAVDKTGGTFLACHSDGLHRRVDHCMGRCPSFSELEGRNSEDVMHLRLDLPISGATGHGAIDGGPVAQDAVNE
jgi:hypothetical protein